MRGFKNPFSGSTSLLRSTTISPREAATPVLTFPAKPRRFLFSIRRILGNFVRRSLIDSSPDASSATIISAPSDAATIPAKCFFIRFSPFQLGMTILTESLFVIGKLSRRYHASLDIARQQNVYPKAPLCPERHNSFCKSQPHFRQSGHTNPDRK